MIRTRMKLRLTHRLPFTVERNEPGYRDPLTGRYIEGALNTFTIQGNQQPLPGNERVMLPEADRSKDYRKLFTATFLYTVDEANQRTPDKVIIDGVAFSVHQRKEYQMGVLDHYEYQLRREEQSAGGTS